MTETNIASNTVQSALNDALRDIDLEPDETAAVLSFVNREVPWLYTPEPTYLVLGSYRDPYIRHVRIVEHELNRRIGSTAFLLGDLSDIHIDRLPTFRIRFHIIAALVTNIVAVFEQDAGGEVTELGKLSETDYFDSTFVLPRDYSWHTARNLETKEAVISAALSIRTQPALNEEEIDEELNTLCDNAQSNGVTVTRNELESLVDERFEEGQRPVQYSWVQLNEFRLFELHDRCFPWSNEDDLRAAVSNVP